MTYSIWSKTGGISAHSFTSTYDNTTEVMGSTGLSNGGSVILSDEINSTADVTQTVLGLGGSVKIQNGIVGDAPDSGDDASSMVVAFNGGYAIAWVSTPTGAEASDLYLAIYDNNGVQQGNDIQVDTGHAAGSISLNGIATHTSGLISVLWSDSSSGTSYESVLGDGDAPVSQSFTATLLEDGAYTFSASDFVLYDAIDTVATSIKITELPTSGTLKLNGLTVTDEQVIALDQISNLVWTPDANVNGNGADVLYFRASDSDGNFSQEAGVTFNITAVGDKPVTDNVHYDVDQKGKFSFNASDFAFSDVDGDTLKYVVITSLATNGSLTFKGDAVEAGDRIAAWQLSKLVYTAPTNKAGDNLASYGFQLEDSAGDLSLAKNITIDVNAVNIAPVAKDDTANAYVDKALKIDVLSNDTDKDGDGLTITKATLEKGAPGTVAIKNGQLVYDSGNVKSLDHGETKTFTISYTVSDGASTDKANVTVTLGYEEDVILTNKNDKYTANQSGKQIFMLDGDDQLAIKSKDIVADTGRGDDHISVGSGFDGGKLFLGEGDDVVKLGDSDLLIFGGQGDDRIFNTGDNDNSKVDGGSGNDRLDGGMKRDHLDGGDGNDAIWGGSGNDYLVGGAGNDVLKGDKGDDTMVVGLGKDSIKEMEGNDTLLIERGAGSIVIDYFDFRNGDRIDLSRLDHIDRFSDLTIKYVDPASPFSGATIHLDKDTVIEFAALRHHLSNNDFIFG